MSAIVSSKIIVLKQSFGESYIEIENYFFLLQHDDMDEKERNVNTREFRTGSSRLLIRTDLLRCVTDVQPPSLIINYDLPNSRENYVHR